MAKTYGDKPSSFLDIGEPYTAFCFDEACAYMISRLEKGDEIVFEPKEVHFESFAAMYRGYSF